MGFNPSSSKGGCNNSFRPGAQEHPAKGKIAPYIFKFIFSTYFNEKISKLANLAVIYTISTISSSQLRQWAHLFPETEHQNRAIRAKWVQRYSRSTTARRIDIASYLSSYSL